VAEKDKLKTPAELDRIVDRVLAYNPKAKKKKPRKRKKAKRFYYFTDYRERA
jgi:hypothetical protein